MPDLFLVKQGLVGATFDHKPGDIIEWPEAKEIPALLEAGILEVHQVAPPVVRKAETPEAPKAKKKETR
jgi:hypothetical protein